MTAWGQGWGLIEPAGPRPASRPHVTPSHHTSTSRSEPWCPSPQPQQSTHSKIKHIPTYLVPYLLSHSLLPKGQNTPTRAPMQKAAPNQRCAFIYIMGPSTHPANPRLWLLLPGRGVQAEGGKGTGEEPGVPKLDFMLSHLQGGAERSSKGPIQEPQGQGHGLAQGNCPRAELEG